jgi:hypothetical protein
MKKNRISIENPCHEDWNRMTPETQGRFCNSCEKIVIDFSEMSDSEILQFFNKPKTEKICGRFKSEQLKQKTESTTPPKTWEQSIFPSATNPLPTLDWQQSTFKSPANPQMPLHRQQPTANPTSNPKPPLQLLHFAYILVLVLGIGVSSCNSETTKGEILMGDTTAMVDSPREETTIGDTVKNHTANTHSTKNHTINSHSASTLKASTNQIKNVKIGESAIIPDTRNRVNDVKKVDKQSRIMGKPKIQRIEKIEPVIMGECVIPYEYDDQEERTP